MNEFSPIPIATGSIPELPQGSTIAAISTPRGEGGVAVIRISGSDALEVAQRVFKPVSGAVTGMKANTVKYGSIIDQSGAVLDTGLITVFRAPRSYTGEDTAELSCHGGAASIREVLRAVILAGASNAAPGEFTKRAFLNGKLSLTQAEAVIDMITAKSGQALKAARGGLNGALGKKVELICNELLKQSGAIAAWIDYPEEDIEDVETDKLVQELKSISNRLDELLRGFATGKLIKEGIKTVIAGKPNVGKSSLMNLLSGYEKSIVTDIAGTTRDIVEEYVTIDGTLLLLCDTAGIRETSDVVEKIGVTRAEELLKNSDLLLAVFDSSDDFTEEDERLLESASAFNTNCVFLLNKSDASNTSKLREWKDKLSKYNGGGSIIEISAATGEGISELKEAILKAVGIFGLDPESGILANERQYEAAFKAKQEIDLAIASLNDGVTLDAVEVLLEEAVSAMLSLSGKRTTEAVVDEVFSKFCVGK